MVVNRRVSSLTNGPNAMGGTVNLLDLRPVSPLEGLLTLGVGRP